MSLKKRTGTNGVSLSTDSQESVDLTHSRIVQKLAAVTKLLELAQHMVDLATAAKPELAFGQIPAQELVDDLSQRYLLAITPTMVQADRAQATSDYHEILTRENFTGQLDHLAKQCTSTMAAIEHAFDIVEIKKCSAKAKKVATKNIAKLAAPKVATNRKKLTADVEVANIAMACAEVRAAAKSALELSVKMVLEKVSFEICECGARMMVIPELSELLCTSVDCGATKTIVGVIFRDEQNAQDGARPRQNKDDTGRHYRKTMNNLQAKNSNVFPAEHLARIEYVIKRDGIIRTDLTCEKMREVLSDPMVKLTEYNDFVPSLITHLGGISPPTLTYKQDQLLSAKFNIAMELHSQVVPMGSNKPNYPFFIAHLIRQFFPDVPEVMRLLKYIHLQSRETVIKNDGIYKSMCAISTEPNKLIYVPTDLSGI